MGYCSRSSVVKIADGFTNAKHLMFDNISELYLVDHVGHSTSIPAQILLGEVLGSDTCALKVRVLRNLLISLI